MTHFSISIPGFRYSGNVATPFKRPMFGSTWERHVDSMEVPWRSHGAPMELPWRSQVAIFIGKPNVSVTFPKVDPGTKDKIFFNFHSLISVLGEYRENIYKLM